MGGDVMGGELVLSVFPGLDGLGYGFELEGFCAVRGPDLIWGRNVRDFHPPAGRFDGVIGGPPCQPFSLLVHLVRANGYEPRHENLIPDFERIVAEAQPAWFLMEEVPAAPAPAVDGYIVRDVVFNNRWTGAEQNRIRFGTRDGKRLALDVAALEALTWERAVVNSSKEGGLAKSRTELATGRLRSKLPSQYARRSMADVLRLQGFPPEFLDECPLTKSGAYRLLGNAVPVPTARAMARGVRRAIGLPLVSEAAS
jgi:DNA (cytosine-5)-methyltransferase 1